MSEIIKAFLGIYLIVLFLTVSVSLLGVSAERAGASEALHTYARELQEGNYARPVFQTCGKQAAEKCWKLTADLEYDTGTGQRVEISKEGEPDRIPPTGQAAGEIRKARLCLEYPVRLPLFRIYGSGKVFCTA
ncbi:molybdopterin biosynthesis enzyme [Clostridium sp. SY8519]|uniref:hypothetical protein n=1 Tax=Clostridium sp. (strain SY8519) TaxID=1042156 RepID=UPI0002171D8A|nr:hypothetical protein [Clostridium sp. SY8519]BAK47711.1 molybdopterin biosynthesis enzyme [Clostridium sp. SY8519]